MWGMCGTRGKRRAGALGLALGLALAVAAPAVAADTTWRVTKDRWTEEDEKGYSAFVQGFGESDCATPAECFRSSANPYRNTDPPGLWLRADCADLIYLMRAYYAWKNGLPFSYAVSVTPREGGGGDIRFNLSGNRIVARRDVKTGANAVEVLRAIPDQVSSATFRVSYLFDRGQETSDFYSPKIGRDTIRPGTVIYDINGHVAIVYKVEDDGRVLYLDAHPDQTLTRSAFGAQFSRGDPALGSGFKNFRPIELTGATRRGDGVLVGGRIEIASNGQIAEFGTEQFLGNQPDPSGDWHKGKFIHDNVEVKFYEFTRLKMSNGTLVYNPVYELRASMRSICGDLKDRVMAVDMSIKAGIHRKDHPGRLPDNIYGTTSMEWEIYSTPSRDARLKTRFVELHNDLAHLIDLYLKRDKRVSYEGLNLKQDLLNAYAEESEACRIAYTNSDGKPVTLTYDQVLRRLYNLSFDPYHCVERRWGATEEDELDSCDDGGTKRRWYEAEQRLRNQIDRTYDARMDFDLSDLRDGPPGSGWDKAPEIDVKALIEGMGDRVKFEGMKPVGL